MNKNKLPNLNMPNTQIESIRNSIAEHMAHGLNAREIQNRMPKITKPELIQVIMDLLEKLSTGGSIKETQLDTRQVATILFSLRYLEQTYDSSGYVHSEHIQGLKPLDQTDINNLCENINLEHITL